MPADRPPRDRPDSGRPRGRPGSGRERGPDDAERRGEPRRGDGRSAGGSGRSGGGSRGDSRRDGAPRAGGNGAGRRGDGRRGDGYGGGSRSDRSENGPGRADDRSGRYRENDRRNGRGDGRSGPDRGRGGARGDRDGRAGRSTTFRSGDRDARGREGGDWRRDGDRGRPGSRRDGRGDARGGAGRGRDGRGGDERGRDGRRWERPEPRTEAERRAEEVRRRRGPRVERGEDHERNKIEARTTEDWIDEGPVSAEEGEGAAPKGPTQRRDSGEVAPIVIAAIYDVAGPSRGAKHVERLARAAGALDRERFGDAKRMLAPLLKEIPNVAAVQEVAGLIAYGQARWGDAAGHLELARRLNEDVALLPVLADAYRAQRRWADVDDVWADIRSASPNQEIMAEGRIVAASALGDQHRYREAVQLLEPAAKPPKRVRDYHLRQWYVLGDLYDRAGDQVAATRWFRLVVAQDADFADVRERLRQLGR